MVPTLPAAIPRRGGLLGKAAGRAALALLRWRAVGELPNAAKFVIIAAPHRSNWDFVIGLAVKLALGIDVSWLGKHTLFRPPFGFLFRFWGGLPVDRTAAHDTVSQVVQAFAAREKLIVVITPEGTRKAGVRWKTGFWHIAHATGAPIMPMAFDWSTRTLRFLPPIETTELEADMARIKEMYAPFRGPRD